MITLDNEEIASIIIKLWDDCSPLMRGKGNQTEFATTLMETFEKQGVSLSVFQEVADTVGSIFETVYNDVYGASEYAEEDIEYDDDYSDDQYYGEY